MYCACFAWYRWRCVGQGLIAGVCSVKQILASPIAVWLEFAFFFFFFQAEDGIRDDLVTGVQTCALPISFPLNSARQRRRDVEFGDTLNLDITATLSTAIQR